ncbi:hypothetical protein APHAL10511_000603 [Amanita phalloides]|nr:hypothetical protein APHAL10511_000603 [Amanita phalloides]
MSFNNTTTLTDQLPTCPPDFRMTAKVWSEIMSFKTVAALKDPQFFVRPGIRPTDLFAVQSNRATLPGYRFIRKVNIRQMLLFVGGACIDDEARGARAGWAICVGPGSVIKGRVECPEAETESGQISNRVELQSAIVALSLQSWKGEGFNSVVVATDSKYVVKGYCDWLPLWKRRKWKTESGTDVVNRDDWEALEKKIHMLARNSVRVRFWRVPSEWNEASKYARQATKEDLKPDDIIFTG